MLKEKFEYACGIFSFSQSNKIIIALDQSLLKLICEQCFPKFLLHTLEQASCKAALKEITSQSD